MSVDLHLGIMKWTPLHFLLVKEKRFTTNFCKVVLPWDILNLLFEQLGQREDESRV